MAVVESTEWIHLNFTECFAVCQKQRELKEIKELDFSGDTRYTQKVNSEVTTQKPQFK